MMRPRKSDSSRPRFIHASKPSAAMAWVSRSGFPATSTEPSPAVCVSQDASMSWRFAARSSGERNGCRVSGFGPSGGMGRWEIRLGDLETWRLEIRVDSRLVILAWIVLFVNRLEF